MSANSFALVSHGGLCTGDLMDLSEIAAEYAPKAGKDRYLNYIKFVATLNKVSRLCELIEITSVAEKSQDVALDKLLKEKISRQAKEFKVLVASEKSKTAKLRSKFKASSHQWLERYLNLISQCGAKIDLHKLDQLNPN